jgi:hypothetical protein
VVRPGFETAFHRWIGSEFLLHRTQATVLDRGASLYDEGERGGLNLDRLPEEVSCELATLGASFLGPPRAAWSWLKQTT